MATGRGDGGGGANVNPGLWFILQAAVLPRAETLRRKFDAVAGFTVSHVFPEPTFDKEDEPGRAGSALLELLVDGLTFELVAHDEGALPFVDPGEPGAAQRRGVALSLVPGPHIQAAGCQLAVIRSQMQLGARLATAIPNCAGLIWPASGWAPEPAEFVEAIAGWTQGNRLPVPGLIQFRQLSDGSLQSTGLRIFSEQELRLEPALTADHGDASRLGARIASMLLHRGQIGEVEQFTGPSGETLRLEPSANGNYVRVWPA